MTLRAPDIARRLHDAADRIPAEAGTPDMDALAHAGSIFIAESSLTDEFLTPFVIADPRALGYGIMLGWLAREQYDAKEHARLLAVARDAASMRPQDR